MAAELRRQGMTQAQVAQVLGVGQQRVSEWENGSVTASGNTSVADLRLSTPRQAYVTIADLSYCMKNQLSMNRPQDCSQFEP